MECSRLGQPLRPKYSQKRTVGTTNLLQDKFCKDGYFKRVSYLNATPWIGKKTLYCDSGLFWPDEVSCFCKRTGYESFKWIETWWIIHTRTSEGICSVCNSVADPGCLSRIPDPDFYPSRIPDPKTATEERSKKNFCHTFLCRNKFHKLMIILVLKCWRKKLGQFSKNYRTFYPKNCHTKLSKIWFGIRDPEKTYSGSRIQGSKRHRIPDPDPQHWFATRLMNAEALFY